MRIEKCWFCSSNVYPGHGKRFIRNDSSVFIFCRSKCHNLFKRRKNPRKTKWTKIYRQINSKELKIGENPIFEFERRMDEPKIYKREILSDAISAIPTIHSIKQRINDIYIKNRILKGQEERKDQDIKFMERYERLLHVKEERKIIIDKINNSSKKRNIKKTSVNNKDVEIA